MLAAAVAGLIWAALAGAAFSQTAPLDLQGPVTASPILRLDQDRLFQQSLYGQRAVAQLEDATRELASENARIDEALSTEEQTLTEQRKTLSADEFRALADAFDEKVVGIRAAQDAKSRALNETFNQSRIAFFERAYPLLFELVRETGALAILDSRAIVLSSSAIDVTDRAIKRVDDVIGDGTDTPPRQGAQD